MKNLPLFFATCALGLLATVAPAQTQNTPPIVYSSCANSDYICWADTGYDRGQAFGRNNSTDACNQESDRANAYANYYRANPQPQPYPEYNNNMVLYWDYYADGIATGHYPGY